MMDHNKVFLKPGVKAEPLVWRWYAWPYLISPLTAACNITDRHLKIMKSYVQAPAVHAQALKNPKLIGGPFLDLNGEKADEIQLLIEQTEINCESLIKLSNAYKLFDNQLQEEAQGQSLEYLYNKLPDSLKGVVELVYDLNNHAAIRIIEPLIYKKYYSDRHQQIVLELGNEDERSFVLSTPKLNSSNELAINLPFSDLRYDSLFQSRTKPALLSHLLDILEIDSDKYERFSNLFTSTSPIEKEDKDYNGEGIRVRYFGHACVLIQTKSTSIMIDPVLSYNFFGDDKRYTFYDLPDVIDYVLLTHNHQDHILFETLLQIRHRVKNVIFPANNRGCLADPSLRLILQKLGFSSLIELTELEPIEFKEGKIFGLPFLGEHADLNIYSKLAHVIHIKNMKFAFCADSNNLDSSMYENIFDIVGNIDVLFLGMECDGAPLSWLYGPLLSKPIKRSDDRSRTLSGSNFEKALPIVQLSKCKENYIYAMGQEPWLNYVMALKYSDDSLQITESNKLVDYCRSVGIKSERLYGRKEWEYF